MAGVLMGRRRLGKVRPYVVEEEEQVVGWGSGGDAEGGVVVDEGVGGVGGDSFLPE